MGFQADLLVELYVNGLLIKIIVDYILPHVYEFFVLLNFSHAIVK